MLSKTRNYALWIAIALVVLLVLCGYIFWTARNRGLT